MKIIALANEDGSIMMTPYQNDMKKRYAKEHPGRMEVTFKHLRPESKKQRGFYHGGVLCLWAYLDGADYRDWAVLTQYHEVAKLEFNSEIVMVQNKPQKIGKTSVGELNELIEACIDNLVDNYGIDQGKVLNPELYKKWRDTIYPFTDKYDTFIDYLLDIGYLQVIHSSALA